MTETIDRLLGSGPSALARLGRGPQLMLLLLGLLVPAVMFFGTQWVSDGQYVPLFASVPPEEGGAILAQLKTAKVPYRIGGAGDQILVPADKVSETRLKLAMQGLPVGGGVGFEVFDRPSLGVSDFAQRLNYQRALQGELARTIGQLREVSRARVHLALPQPSLFTDRERPASASVFLKLQPGAQLGREQVRGIVHLVASSVEGLSPDRVTLVDTAGRVLAIGGDSPASALSPRRLEIKTAIEESLERRVQTLLDSALGPGQAISRVSAQVNFDQIERTEEKYDPNAVLRQKTHSTETTKGRTSTPVGLATNATAPAPAPAPDPAAAAAVAAAGTPPAPPGPPANVTSNDGTRESESVTYEVSRIVARTLTSPGEIQRLSVAVVLNAAKPGAAADAKPQGRSAEDLEKIRKVVMSAVGFSETRGDAVTVAEMPFDTSVLDRERALLDQPVAEAPAKKTLPVGQTVIIAGAAVGVLLLALVVWLLLRGRARTRARVQVARVLDTDADPARGRGAAPAVSASAGAAAHAQVAGAMHPAIARTPQPIVPEELLQLSREREDIRQKAFALANNEPDATAQLLRAWLVKKKPTHTAVKGVHDA
jgi:flagellar M-ring protein FliF